MSERLFIGGVADGKRINIPDDCRGHYQVPIPRLAPIYAPHEGELPVPDRAMDRDTYSPRLFVATDEWGKAVDFTFMGHMKLDAVAILQMLERGYLRTFCERDAKELTFPLNTKPFVAKAMEQYRTLQSWVGAKSTATVPDIN